MTKLVFLCSVALLMASVFDLRGQNPPQNLGTVQAGVVVPYNPPQQISKASMPELTKFDLDFKGGPPAELVKAIEAAWHKPLNAIIPEEVSDTQLPALKMKAVTLPQLFEALAAASDKQFYQQMTVSVPSYTIARTSFGFRTAGRPQDDSIWYFYCLKPALPPEFHQPKVCRFYQLAPFLESYKIEDITTAIQTGWKMLGETSPPPMNFHKDTKLLIVVADAEQLKLIDSVLLQLKPEPKISEPTMKAGERIPEPTKRGDGKSQ